MASLLVLFAVFLSSHGDGKSFKSSALPCDTPHVESISKEIRYPFLYEANVHDLTKPVMMFRIEIRQIQAAKI